MDIQILLLKRINAENALINAKGSEAIIKAKRELDIIVASIGNGGERMDATVHVHEYEYKPEMETVLNKPYSLEALRWACESAIMGMSGKGMERWNASNNYKASVLEYNRMVGFAAYDINFSK